jgi:hypothetical protein
MRRIIGRRVHRVICGFVGWRCQTSNSCREAAIIRQQLSVGPSLRSTSAELEALLREGRKGAGLASCVNRRAALSDNRVLQVTLRDQIFSQGRDRAHPDKSPTHVQGGMGTLVK